jgi:nucleoid DNA-binding protein
MLIDGEGKATLKSTDSADAEAVISTKANLIEEISRVLEIPRKAAVIVERILESLVHALDRGDKVEIRGFGSFRTRQRKARVGRNPKTGARRSAAQENCLLQTQQETSRTG